MVVPHIDAVTYERQSGFMSNMSSFITRMSRHMVSLHTYEVHLSIHTKITRVILRRSMKHRSNTMVLRTVDNF